MINITAKALLEALQGYKFEIGQTIYSVSHRNGYIRRHKIYGINVLITADGITAHYRDQDNKNIQYPTPNGNYFGDTKSIHKDRRAARKAAAPDEIKYIKEQIEQVHRDRAASHTRENELQEELRNAENRTGDQN